ncbi:MAG: hypothetical protein J1F64_03025 [Oscillospiraceae bacterium]|nr:hypothetical protein [Oscillospiraceae bacterium]
MNTEKAEEFIGRHKAAVYSILITIIVCCAAAQTVIGSGRSEYKETISRSIIRGGTEKGPAINGPEEAVTFGRIYINNVCPEEENSIFHISEKEDGYMVYRDGGSLDFNRYYKLYPYASVKDSGKISVHMRRKFQTVPED